MEQVSISSEDNDIEVIEDGDMEEIEDGDVEEEMEECRCKRCLTPQIGRSNISIKFSRPFPIFILRSRNPGVSLGP